MCAHLPRKKQKQEKKKNEARRSRRKGCKTTQSHREPPLSSRGATQVARAILRWKRKWRTCRWLFSNKAIVVVAAVSSFGVAPLFLPHCAAVCGMQSFLIPDFVASLFDSQMVARQRLVPAKRAFAAFAFISQHHLACAFYFGAMFGEDLDTSLASPGEGIESRPPGLCGPAPLCQQRYTSPARRLCERRQGVRGHLWSPVNILERLEELARFG